VTAVDVSIVIVTYNAPDEVRRCLASVTGDAAPSVSHEVIALDNASSPSLVPLLREFLPEKNIIDSATNVGFGRACNLGAQRAKGRYVLLLNPDAIAHPGAVDTMVRLADAEARCGILGGQTVDDEGRVDPRSCWGRPTLWSLLCFATGLSTVARGNALLDPESLGRWGRDSTRDVDIVTGCLMLVPRDVWEEVGGFDRDFFMYGEDADLCRRVGLSGRRVWIDPRAVASHSVGASSPSSGAKTVLLLAGRMTYVGKHFHGARGSLVRGRAPRCGFQAGRSSSERLGGRVGPALGVGVRIRGRPCDGAVRLRLADEPSSAVR
jgi:GT2 family glycosyltransferase